MKKRNFKIRLNGWSAIVIVSLLIVLAIAAVVLLPMFILFGLYNILAKFELAHIDLFESFWHDCTYFGGFILLLFIIIFAIDFLMLFILATFKIQLTKLVDLVGTLIQFLLSIAIFKMFMLPTFSRISMEWPAILILLGLLYVIIAVFSYEKNPVPPEE